MRAWLKVAQFGYVLEVGRIVMEGAQQKLLDSKDIQEFYLGKKEESARAKGVGNNAKHGVKFKSDNGSGLSGRGSWIIWR